jgi:hypothetical protein
VGKAYVFGPTFRAEKSKTRRHLTEFWMVEPEVAYLDLDGAMDLALLLEWACTVYWRAAVLGTPRVLDSQQRDAVIAAATERGYGALRTADLPDEQAEETG